MPRRGGDLQSLQQTRPKGHFECRVHSNVCTIGHRRKIMDVQIRNSPGRTGDEEQRLDNVRASDSQTERADRAIDSKPFRCLRPSPIGRARENVVSLRVLAAMALRAAFNPDELRGTRRKQANGMDTGGQTTVVDKRIQGEQSRGKAWNPLYSSET